MTKLSAILAVLALAVSVLLLVLFQFGLPPFAREPASGEEGLAGLTATPAPQLPITTGSSTPVSTTPPVTAVAAGGNPSVAGALATPDLSIPVDWRPLNLPALGAGEQCPTTLGTSTTVPHVRYIFCAGCVWFGTGPVYFALAWNDSSQYATFSLDPVPYESGAYWAKTPWVSQPDYAGPILVRGRQLDGAGQGVIRFTDGQSSTPGDLRLEGYGGPNATEWSFWPSSMVVPGPGCYGVQIDTLSAAEVVIFEATLSRSGRVLKHPDTWDLIDFSNHKDI